MEITLSKTGKKFDKTWIFRNVDYTFHANGSYAILGGNGSGKSTLLQIISGFQSPSSGSITYTTDAKKFPVEQIYSRLTLATPYMELPEELSLYELLRFHSHFKKPLLPLTDIAARINLEKETHKELKNFSSGMRQRVRLGLALLFESEMVLLDEPCTHLDHHSIAWYQQLLEEYTFNKCLIISSNQPEEYNICKEYLLIEDFKKK